MNLLIIVGSVREGRYADTILDEIAKHIPEDVSLNIFDPKLTPLPFVDGNVTPSMAEGKFENDNVAKLNELVEKAHLVILLSPEYNHSTSAVLKNSIDWVAQPWKDKNVLIINYSYQMTGLPVKHLTDIMIELQAVVSNLPIVPIGGYYDYDLLTHYLEDLQPDASDTDDEEGGKTPEE